MHKRRTVLCSLLALGGVVLCFDVAQARTVCESTSTTAPAKSEERAVPAEPAATTATTAKLADETPAATGAAAPSSAGGDDEAGNLGGGASSSVRKRGLRWQSLLPGVIK